MNQGCKSGHYLNHDWGGPARRLRLAEHPDILTCLRDDCGMSWMDAYETDRPDMGLTGSPQPGYSDLLDGLKRIQRILHGPGERGSNRLSRARQVADEVLGTPKGRA